MKNIFKFIFSILCLFSLTNVVNAATSSISVKANGDNYEYVDGLDIYHHKSGNYNVYVLNSNTYYYTSQKLIDPIEADKGFAYIISNDNSTSDSKKNYYITQVAILWYQDYLNGNDYNISANLKSKIQNTTGDTVCYYINKLVNNAKSYNDEESIYFQDKTVTFTRNGSYYYSNVIDVVAKNVPYNPTIKLYNAPTSSTIINNTVTKNGGSFQIRIPVNSINTYDRDFEVYITGKSSNNIVYKYTNSGADNVIYGRVYSSNSSTSTVASLPINIKGVENTNVRIKVLDENDNYIRNIKYNIYSGNCENTSCDSDNLIHTFTTSSTYTTLNNILSEGTYTFVRKTSTSYDLEEKELINVEDTTSVQTFILSETNNNNYKNLNIYNTLNDSSNIIKVYNNNDILIDSFRADKSSYSLKLNDGYYYIVDSEETVEVDFKITNGNLYVKIGANYTYKDSINLEDYLIRYINNNNNNNNSNNNNNNNSNSNNNTNNNNNSNDYYIDEDGKVHIDNLEGIDNIEISQDVETTTDVKIEWISDIIDCPPTSVSSTLKYVIGAILLGLGTYLTIRNVKKSKNNI